MDLRLMRSLALTDGEEVLVEPWAAQHVCTRVHVRPNSEDDWEILEDNAQVVEMCLLGQARVVWTGLCLPIWITSTAFISVTIGTLKAKKKKKKSKAKKKKEMRKKEEKATKSKKKP